MLSIQKYVCCFIVLCNLSINFLCADAPKINALTQPDPLSKNIPKTMFYYVRHGQTDWNRDKKFQGTSDIPLNTQGREQAVQAGQVLLHCKPSMIFSSQLSRAKETAEIIKSQLNASQTITILEDLKERFGGVGEGQVVPPDFVLLKDQPAWFFQNAEPINEFRERVVRGVLVALNFHGPVCLVSHGGVFRVLCQVLGIPIDKPATHAGVVRFVPTEQGWVMEQVAT